MKSWTKGMLTAAILILFVTGIVNGVSLRTSFVFVGLLAGTFFGLVIAAIITLIRDKEDYFPWALAVVIAIFFFFSSFVVVGQKYVIIEKEGTRKVEVSAFVLPPAKIAYIPSFLRMTIETVTDQGRWRIRGYLKITDNYQQVCRQVEKFGEWENWKENISKVFEEAVKGYIEKYIPLPVPNVSNLKFDLWLASESLLTIGVLEAEANVEAIQ